VVTGDMVEALVFAGADIIKVGIGPGSVCTTGENSVWLIFRYFYFSLVSFASHNDKY